MEDLNPKCQYVKIEKLQSGIPCSGGADCSWSSGWNLWSMHRVARTWTGGSVLYPRSPSIGASCQLGPLGFDASGRHTFVRYSSCVVQVYHPT